MRGREENHLDSCSPWCGWASCLGSSGLGGGERAGRGCVWDHISPQRSRQGSGLSLCSEGSHLSAQKGTFSSQVSGFLGKCSRGSGSFRNQSTEGCWCPPHGSPHAQGPFSILVRGQPQAFPPPLGGERGIHCPQEVCPFCLGRLRTGYTAPWPSSLPPCPPTAEC